MPDRHPASGLTAGPESVAVDAVLREGEAGGLVAVTVGERATETYRQGKRGRPGPETKYVRRRATRSDLPWHPDHGRLAQEARCDGASPLVTNVTALSAPELSLAYEQPPPIETRFGQLKTDCVVAPVLLEEASRVQALSCVYSVAVRVEALLGRELRRATEGAGVESLPLYPEGRACRRPTSRRVIDLSEDVRRPERKAKGRPVVVFTTELARPQRPVLRLLGMPGVYSG